MFGIPSNLLIPAIGVIVLVLVNTPALSYIQAMLSKKVKTDTPVPVETPTVDNSPVAVPTETRLPEIYEIVEQWDKIRRMCEKANLKESVKSLDAVFLNLLKRANSDDKSIS